MSDEPHDGRIREPKNGGGSAKWVVGGAAALLLLGGGYFAWKTATASRDATQAAYSDPYSAEPLSTGALDAGEDASSQSIAADASAAAPASSESRAARRARAEAIPEVTIGVTPASADVPGGEDSDEIVVTAPHQPIWSRTPSPQRLSSLYPERALSRGREGEARLHCVVQAGGALDCESLSATPGGFGAAALRVARSFRHAPTLENGADAVGSSVRLRVVFRMEEPRRRRR